MASFNIENPLQQLEQSGLAGVTLNDNAAPAANVIYSSLKSGGGGSTPPATTTSLGTIQLAGVLTGIATSPQLAAGSVGASQLAPGAVNASSIAPGSITGSSLAPGTITSTQLAPGSVGSSQIANGAVGSSQIANGAVGSSQIANGAVGASQIANGAIGPMQLAPLSGPSELIGSNSTSPNAMDITLGPSLQMSPTGVLSVNPSAVTVAPSTTTSLGTIQLAGVLTGTATSPQLAAGSVGASQLAPGAVTSSSIAPGSISGSSLAPGSVTSSQLAAGSVGTSQLAPLPAPSELLGSSSTSSAVTDIMLGSGLSMTGSVLSVNASTAVPPATSSSLGTVQLAGSLTGSATAPSLATNSVGSSQISAGAVGATQLGANVVGNGQLAPLSGPSELIGSNSSSPAASNITLGTGLSMSSGGVLSVNASTAVPAATSSSLGTIQLAGALSGTATSPTLSAGSVGATQIVAGSVGATQLGANVVGNSQLAALSGPSELIGSASGSSAATNIILGSGLTMTGNTLNSTIGTIPIPVSQGGTGLTTIPSGSILLGNGTSPITTASSIPATMVTPNLVGSVNGVVPSSAGGNVSVVIGSVTTGVLSAQPAQPQPNGNIYVVSGDPTPANNGRTFISNGTTWNEVTNNIATTDARYVQLAGSTMNASANLVFPSTGHVTLNQTTFASTDAVTAQYVASQIASGSTPAATTTSLGTIQLAGSLTGTATSPSIASGVVTQTNMASNSIGSAQIIAGSVGATQLGANVVGTGQLAPLSANSELLGSNSSSPAATNITLGSGLSMTGSVLSVNASTAVPAATSSSLGTIQLAGALTGSATAPTLATGSVGATQIVAGSVGATQLGANVVGNGQLAPLSAPSELIGSNSASPNATNISLGSGLTMSSGGVLSVDASTAVPAATSSSLGTIQLSGALSGSATSPTLSAGSVGSTQIANGAVGASQIANGAVGATQMAANSVGTGQLAALSGTSQLIGSNSSSSAATNITLGTGLSMSSGGVLSATAVAPAPATSTSLGTIQLAGSLSGTATAPTIANNAIGTAQLANNAVGTAQLANGAVGISQLAPLPATSELIGSSSGSTTASAITLGSGLTMSAGGQLSVNLTGVPIPAATSSSLGGIEMLGDLTGSSATAPTVAAGAITLSKMANLSGNSQLIGSSSTSAAPTNITLGPSMSIIASQLNSGVSFVSGPNPNLTAPTDRPTTSNVLYVGTDGSVWIYQSSSSSYITISGTQLYLSSNTNITIPSGSNSMFPVSDLAISVANNQTVRASYYLRYQTVSAAWAPSFAFTGLNASTDVLMGSGWWPQNIGNSTAVTMYSFCGSQASTVINTFDSNVPSVLAGGSNTGPTFNATNNFTTCTLEIEYKNLSGSTVSLVVQFARDINNTSNAVRLTGGSVAYTFH